MSHDLIKAVKSFSGYFLMFILTHPPLSYFHIVSTDSSAVLFVYHTVTQYNNQKNSAQR